MKDITITKPISQMGITSDAFDAYLKDFVTTTIEEYKIIQTGTVNGVNYSLTILLGRWAEKTPPEKIVILSRLFWQCYPKMYMRFGEAGQSPTEVVLNIENRGYGIAWASGNLVHLHDGWLKKAPTDYDCITHELAHVIQNGWDDKFCEYGGFIERFADCCRYLYAFNDGEYNDFHWELQTIRSECKRESSVRFLVWFDYFYSTDKNDLLLNYFKVCRSQKYPAENWREAWKEIFKGSELDGRDIEDIWQQFATTEFATLSSKRSDEESPLLQQHPIRKKLD